MTTNWTKTHINVCKSDKELNSTNTKLHYLQITILQEKPITTAGGTQCQKATHSEYIILLLDFSNCFES